MNERTRLVEIVNRLAGKRREMYSKPSMAAVRFAVVCIGAIAVMLVSLGAYGTVAYNPLLKVDLFTVDAYGLDAPGMEALINRQIIQDQAVSLLREALVQRGKNSIRVEGFAGQPLLAPGHVTLRIYVSIRSSLKEPQKPDRVIIAAAIQPLRLGKAEVTIGLPAPEAALAQRDAADVAAKLRAVLRPGLDAIALGVNQQIVVPPPRGIEVERHAPKRQK
jgi:hypothetical protein